jgi:hypothetical protein
MSDGVDNNFGVSRPIQGSCAARLHVTPTRRSSVPMSPRVPSSAADEIQALRAHNEALQRQLNLKDQGLERLRQKVHERALMLSHQQAADQQQTRREAGSVIGELEAENAKLRADLAHRTSQLHSAVTRIGALKSRMDDLILQNDELMHRQDRTQRSRAAARKRRQTLKERTPGVHAHREAMASLLGTQDSMLTLIENLSFLPPHAHEPPPPKPTPATSRPPRATSGADGAATRSGADGLPSWGHGPPPSARRVSGGCPSSAAAPTAYVSSAAPPRLTPPLSTPIPPRRHSTVRWTRRRRRVEGCGAWWSRRRRSTLRVFSATFSTRPSTASPAAASP